MATLSRRSVLGAGLLAAAAPAAISAKPMELPNKAAEQLASDESFWSQVAARYSITRDVIQLENGNWGSMANPVLDAYERNVRRVNRENSYYSRREFGPEMERVRSRIARSLGAAAEEIALTRNATEALQALIGGYNRLSPGDAVLFADLDYDAMQMAMQWLKVRRGVDVVSINLPEPATHQSLIDAYEAALKANPRVRLMLLTHLSHRTGLVLPVAEIVALARRHQVDVIVDSAHAWGQLDFKLDESGVEFAGFNAHKWIGAPLGVGVMYIRRSRIGAIDPFMGDTSFAADDIRSRVHSGTSNFAAFMTVTDALDFHEAIGTPAKEARLRYLRDLWAEPLRDSSEWQILTPPDKRLYVGITSFRRRGRTSVKENVQLAKQLLDQAKIFTVHRAGLASGACVRVTPSIFTSPADIAILGKTLQGAALRF